MGADPPRPNPNRGGPTLTAPLCPPPRRNHPGPAEQPARRHRYAVAGGLVGGRQLRRGALPALHQPHLAGVLGKARAPAQLRATGPAGCFNTRRSFQDYSKCKEIMIERGEIFLRKVSLSRNKIAKLCHPFIRDGAVSRPGQLLSSRLCCLRCWEGRGGGGEAHQHP